MSSTACFVIVSRDDRPIYESEVGTAPKVAWEGGCVSYWLLVFGPRVRRKRQRKTELVRRGSLVQAFRGLCFATDEHEIVALGVALAIVGERQ